MTYAKVVAHKGRRRLRSRFVVAIVLAAAMATGIAVTLAAGAMAASQHSKAVTHHSTTAHLEKHPKGGTRDVGFTG